jgi:hypothetical protein
MKLINLSRVADLKEHTLIKERPVLVPPNIDIDKFYAGIQDTQNWYLGYKHQIPFTLSNNYEVIDLQCHPLCIELKERLAAVYFFDFHVSNNGFLITTHQVVAYLFGSGRKAYRNGFVCRVGETEIHHRDSNPRNNNPGNLVYVSPNANKILAALVNQKSFSKVEQPNQPILWNNSGNPVKCQVHHFINIALSTIRLTAANRKEFSQTKENNMSLNHLVHVARQTLTKGWDSAEKLFESGAVCVKSVGQLFDRCVQVKNNFLTKTQEVFVDMSRVDTPSAREVQSNQFITQCSQQLNIPIEDWYTPA